MSRFTAGPHLSIRTLVWEAADVTRLPDTRLPLHGQTVGTLDAGSDEAGRLHRARPRPLLADVLDLDRDDVIGVGLSLTRRRVLANHRPCRLRPTVGVRLVRTTRETALPSSGRVKR